MGPAKVTGTTAAEAVPGDHQPCLSVLRLAEELGQEGQEPLAAVCQLLDDAQAVERSRGDQSPAARRHPGERHRVEDVEVLPHLDDDAPRIDGDIRATDHRGDERGHVGGLVVGGNVREIRLVGGLRRPPDALPTASGSDRRQRRYRPPNDLRRLVRELAELEVADDVGVSHR